MIIIKTLIDNLVTELRKVPELVTAMNGDAENIYAYHDLPAENSSIERARQEMQSPSIMVSWDGSSSGSGIEPWNHRININIRAPQDSTESSPTGYYAICDAIWNGYSNYSDGFAVPPQIKNRSIIESCLPMNPPSIQRITDAQGIDYFQFSTSFDQIGDE